MLLYLEFITAVTTYLDGLTMKDIAAWTAAVTLSGRCRALVGPSHLELCVLPLSSPCESQCMLISHVLLETRFTVAPQTCQELLTLSS